MKESEIEVNGDIRYASESDIYQRISEESVKKLKALMLKYKIVKIDVSLCPTKEALKKKEE